MKVFWAGAGLVFVFAIAFTSVKAQTIVGFTQNLAYQEHGLEVTALQNFLTADGVYNGPITGNFLSHTYKAVKAFQIQQGITPDSGYFGPLTRAAANAVLASISASSTSQNSPTTSDVTQPAVSEPVTTVVTTSDTSSDSSSSNSSDSNHHNHSNNQQASTTQQTSGQTTYTPPTTVVSNSGIQWGAYNGDDVSDTAAFESEVGAQENLVAVFVGWGSTNGPFPSQYESSVANAGKTLVIFWEPSDNSGSLTEPDYNYQSITSGSWDSYFTQFAADAKAYGGPVIIVPFAEMNGNWDPWDGTVNGNSAQSFIAAWQHMHGFFSSDSNVKFAWDVNSDSEPDISSNSVTSYWPGSSYVDYVGEDVFNFDNPWSSFAQIAQPTLSQLQTYGKPIYIFSMASAPGSQKAAWITDALSVQIPSDGIAGWIWFNDDKEENWLVNSDPASLAAFEAGIPN